MCNQYVPLNIPKVEIEPVRTGSEKQITVLIFDSLWSLR